MRVVAQSTLPYSGRIYNYADKLILYTFVFNYFYNVDDLECVETLTITDSYQNMSYILVLFFGMMASLMIIPSILMK